MAMLIPAKQALCLHTFGSRDHVIGNIYYAPQPVITETLTEPLNYSPFGTQHIPPQTDSRGSSMFTELRQSDRCFSFTWWTGIYQSSLWKLVTTDICISHDDRRWWRRHGLGSESLFLSSFAWVGFFRGIHPSLVIMSSYSVIKPCMILQTRERGK